MRENQRMTGQINIMVKANQRLNGQIQALAKQNDQNALQSTAPADTTTHSQNTPDTSDGLTGTTTRLYAIIKTLKADIASKNKSIESLTTENDTLKASAAQSDTLRMELQAAQKQILDIESLAGIIDTEEF